MNINTKTIIDGIRDHNNIKDGIAS